MDTDRNLLFAVAALQLELLTEAQFTEACTAWAAERVKSLPDLLVERGWISPEDRLHLDYMVQRQLSRHGQDVRACLAQLTSDRLRAPLATLVDPRLRKSLDTLPVPKSGHVLLSTMAYESGSRDRYTLTRLHAKGGIGQVWLARDADLGREVALKELRPEMADNPALWARFLEEARITGQLEHPGIVPIYELARSSGDQRPFYTMRFIRGRTLRDAAQAYHRKRLAGQAEALDLRELLSNFVAVCNAVAYAHARGVLHRDLKGENVVLGDFGEVMVLDWGLAKLLGEPHRDRLERAGLGRVPAVVVAADAGRGHTQQGDIMGTPGCMAPEQAEGKIDQIDRRTDVYGLGAILYEILTGEAPFAGEDTEKLLRKVVQEAPRPPRRLVATTPVALEAICLKCLAKNPAERYDNGTALAQDIQHFLADEPVTVFREPVTVRAGRWMRHHRTGVVSGMAAVVVAALCFATASFLLLRAYREADAQRALASEQRDKAREHFELARAAVDQFDTRVSESAELKAQGLELLRQKLLESAVDFYQKFVQERTEDPAIRAEQGRAHKRLADVARLLDRNDQALSAYQQARTIFTSLAEEHPDDPDYARERANAYYKIGRFYHDTGRYSEAEPPYQEALTLGQSLLDAHPDVVEYRHDLAGTQHSLARLYRDSDRIPMAEPLYRQSLAVRRELVKDFPGVAVYQDELGWSLSNLGNLYNRQEKFDASEKAYNDTLAVWRKLAASHADVPAYASQVAMTLNSLANLYADTGRSDQAVKLHEQTLAVRQQMLDAHPHVTENHEELAKSYNNLGTVYQDMGRLDLAQSAYQQALTIRQRLVDAHPEVLDYAANHADTECQMGLLFRDLGQLREALDWYNQAEARLRSLLKKEPHHAEALNYVRVLAARRAVAFSQLGRAAEAGQSLAQANIARSSNPEMRMVRVLVSAYTADIPTAQTLAEEVARGRGLAGRDYLDLACAFALCRQDAQALAMLRKAQAAGYFQSGAGRVRLEKEPALVTLHARPDYRQWAADVVKEGK